MDMKQRREFRIGIFVLAVLVISFFVINFLRGKDIFGKEMTIVSSYDNVEGLVQSDPVYIKGYKAGSVSSVEYNPDTDKFDVECSVLKKFRIPEDSRMTIYSRDIMGGKAIRIDSGVSSESVADGARLEPDIQPDMLSSLSGQIEPLVGRLNATLENLDSITASVNIMLGSENRQSIQRTLANLELTLAQARKISETLGGKSDELNTFIDNMSSVSAKLDAIAGKTEKAVDDVGAVTGSLKRSDIEGMVTSFRSLLESIQSPDGTIGRLLLDDSVYRSFDSLVSGADSLLKKIEENPKKYIKISVF